MSSIDDMIAAAGEAMSKAYAPYSGFPVGAVMRGESGTLYSGCNVENAAYPQGWCAETSAIAAMVTAGEQCIVEVVVMGGGPLLCTPCGGCRQKLREFGSDDLPVHICGPDGLRRTVTLGELYPLSFSPENLR